MKGSTMQKTSMFLAVVATLGAAFASELPLSDEAALKIARGKLAEMTLEEKVSLCGGCGTMRINAIPRLGIRSWVMSDASSGIKPEHGDEGWPYVPGATEVKCTVLPSLDALASTWNPELARLHGTTHAEQMRARGKDMILGPGVNITRTPLCGRVWEYLGEDPFLAGRMAVNYIQAAQQLGVACTVKHFCLNNQELNRFKTDVTCDERALYEIYLPAFEAAVTEGGSLSLMTSYNKYNGVHTSENPYLLRCVLRDRFGYKGMIVSDWGGHHSTVAAALNGATCEMNAGNRIVYFTDFWHKKTPLVDAVKAGKVPMSVVDEMALYNLYPMAKSGFLTDEQQPGRVLVPEHFAAAERIADESFTLLKNEKGVLPLARPAAGATVAVVGLKADGKVCHLGNSAESRPIHEVTPFAGIRELLGADVKVELVPMPNEASMVANGKPIDTACLETYDGTGSDAFPVRSWEMRCWKRHRDFYNGKKPEFSSYLKEPRLIKANRNFQVVQYRAKVKFPMAGEFGFQLSAGSDGEAMRMRLYATGDKPPLWTYGSSSVVVKAQEGEVKEFVFEVRSNDVFCHDYQLGWQLPSERASSREEVIKQIAAADQIIVFTGTTLGYGHNRESEGVDRDNMKNESGEDEAIAELLALNHPRLVVVQRSGAQQELPWVDKCATLLHQPYAGQEAGKSLAKILYGEVNPSGRLVASWPYHYEDLWVAQPGAYESEASAYKEGIFVGYRWFDRKGIKPMFPFGYGLSYTTFSWGEGAVAKTGEGEWTARIAVRNAGKVAGREVVELFVAQRNPTEERAVQELKGFAKLELAPGEEKTAEIKLDLRSFALYDTFLNRWRVPAGEYEIRFSASAAEVRSTATVVFEKDVVL